MTLLDDVIDQASDGDAAAMLRKLMIVAHRLGAAELLAWVKGELNGYDDADSLPTYRGPLNITVHAVIAGPGGSQGKNTLSKQGVPDGFEGLFQLWMMDPLAGLEAFASTDNGISIPWDPAAVGFYNRWIKDGKVPFIEGWGVYGAHKWLSSGTLRGIVDVVRTKALELALDLQSRYPNAGEKDGPTVADPAVQATVTHITNNIYGPVNGLAQGGTVSQNVTVQVGDIAGALDAAKEFLASESMVEFAKVLADDGDDAAKRTRLERFAQRVRSGAVALTSGVVTDVAAAELIKLASQFFGWS